MAPQSVLDTLIANGQIATQYVDQDGNPSMDMKYNPNGSVLAIEGITSRMAVSSARWAIRSAAASTCTRTSPATSTSLFSRAAWTISRFDGKIALSDAYASAPPEGEPLACRSGLSRMNKVFCFGNDSALLYRFTAA